MAVRLQALTLLGIASQMTTGAPPIISPSAQTISSHFTSHPPGLTSWPSQHIAAETSIMEAAQMADPLLIIAVWITESKVGNKR